MEGGRLERVPSDGEEEEGRKGDEEDITISASRLLVLGLSSKKKYGSDLENKKNKTKQKNRRLLRLLRELQGLTLNIRGMTPAKWLSIQGLSVFPSPDYIILTEHQLSAEFRPDEIIKSGWDFHAVSGTVLTLPHRGYQGQRYRGGLALLTRNSMRFSITN